MSEAYRGVGERGKVMLGQSIREQVKIVVGFAGMGEGLWKYRHVVGRSCSSSFSRGHALHGER